jgi:tetratricopeptide (TPR) repeat protein
MSKALLPLFLKVGTCATVTCMTGVPDQVAVGLLGNAAYDLLKKIPGLRRLRPLGQPNHDLQKALARAIAKASKDKDLDKMIRDATRSLADLDPPHHYEVEQFLADLDRRPEEILLIDASNVELKAFLEAPDRRTFQPLGGILGEKHLPGLDAALRTSIVNAIHLQIAARFWDEIKGDDRAWRAYSAEVFAELRASLANLATGQHEILAALGQREIHIAAAPAILPEAAAAIDISRADLEKDFQALHSKLDALLRGQREIKGEMGEMKAMLAELLATKEEQTREFQQAGRRIQDIPQEEIEADLARRLSLPVEALRARIAAGLKSQDALTRSRAELLAGQRDAAIATATEAKLHHADAIRQLIAADQIIAQAHFEKAEYLPALASRHRIAALVDPRVDQLGWAEALHEVAVLHYYLGSYSEALALLNQIITIKDQELGPEARSSIESLNLFAFVLLARGRTAEAEPILRRCLERGEENLGRSHPYVAAWRENLALALLQRGKHSEAESLFRISIEAALLQPQQLPFSYEITLSNLGELYRSQGRLKEAEPLYRQALEIANKSHGEEHPNTAMILNNLGNILRDQGKLDEAEPLFRHALRNNEASLGDNHPSVAICLNNLAILLQIRGNLHDAELLFRRALEIERSKLGNDHPSVAIRLNNLALLLSSQGKLTAAEPLFRLSLETFFRYRKCNGVQHQHEKGALKNYTEFLESTLNTTEEIRTKILGIEREAGLGD